MDNRTYLLAAGLVVCIAIGMLLFTYFSSTEIVLDHSDSTTTEPSAGEPASGNDAESPESPESDVEEESASITLTRSFREGETVISGSIITPTPCHKIKSEVVILESYPEQVIIDMRLTPSSDPCMQVLAEQDWEVVVGAVSEEASVTLQVDGQVVPTTVITSE